MHANRFDTLWSVETDSVGKGDDDVSHDTSLQGSPWSAGLPQSTALDVGKPEQEM